MKIGVANSPVRIYENVQYVLNDLSCLIQCLNITKSTNPVKKVSKHWNDDSLNYGFKHIN